MSEKEISVASFEMEPAMTHQDERAREAAIAVDQYYTGLINKMIGDVQEGRLKRSTESVRAEVAELILKHFPAPAAAMGERERFEAWCVSEHGYKKAPTRDGAGYLGAEARMMWNVWQAALSRGVVAPPAEAGAALANPIIEYCTRYHRKKP